MVDEGRYRAMGERGVMHLSLVRAGAYVFSIKTVAILKEGHHKIMRVLWGEEM